MGQPNTAPPQLIGTSEAPPYVPPPGSPPVGAGATPVAPPPTPIDYKSLGSGQAAADFAAASAGDGWEFDVDAMNAVIKDLQTSLDNEYSQAQNDAAWLTQIKSPGTEVGSEGYVAAANASGASYQRFLQSGVEYTTSYLETLKQIRDAYQRQDHAALEALRATGKVD
jgi:hypothetical protein